MNNLSVIGIDLAKQVFQLHGLDQEGRSILKKKLSRHQMLRFFAQIPPCLIGMEACGGSHYWARELSKEPLRNSSVSGLTASIAAIC